MYALLGIILMVFGFVDVLGFYLGIFGFDTKLMLLGIGLVLVQICANQAKLSR